MAILAWKDFTTGSRINALIEELRWGRYEFFDLVEVEPRGEQSIITLPSKIEGHQAIVVVLSPENLPSKEKES
jgi:hypothetical protein